MMKLYNMTSFEHWQSMDLNQFNPSKVDKTWLNGLSLDRCGLIKQVKTK